uniref:Uncharacterized protein n=1 Tax=Tanacetum cinerariifolium TaxID=118510 RepID=A0A699J2F1_TANCI|nr:hypothetical protein [Tanacetum cinerariifolium]
MTQFGSGVAGLSSSGIGFNHSGLGLMFKRWVESVSSESDISVVSSIAYAGKYDSRVDSPTRRKKSVPHSEQPVEEVPILDDVNILDSKDTDTTHLPKIRTRPNWLKPIPEEDILKTLEPDWVIPPNDLPEAENNWANALAKKKKLTKDDLEGPAYMTVKPFHTNNISLQFQMEDFYRLLSNKIDLINVEGHRVVPDVSKPSPLGGPPAVKEVVQIALQDLLKERFRDLSEAEMKEILHDQIFKSEKDKSRKRNCDDQDPPPPTRKESEQSKKKKQDSNVSGSKQPPAPQSSAWKLLTLDKLLLAPSSRSDNERRCALSISKLKVAHYLDFGLEELVLSLWNASERDYDISAAYVKSHMWILSVTSLKMYEIYGYTYLREIVLRIADYNEYKISEADFKNLHLNNFKDLYFLHLQGKLNHLPRSDKVHLFNAVNMWIRNIVIRQRVADLQLGIESYQTKLNL